MPSPIILAIYALAVARVTRMITADKIFERPRRALIVRAWRRAYPYVRREPTRAEQDKELRSVMGLYAQNPPLAAYLIVCPWCVSIWTGAAVAPAVWWYGARPWLLIPALALALSYATGFLASHEG